MQQIWIETMLNETHEVNRKGTCIHLAVWLLIWEVTRLKLLVALVVAAVDEENFARFFRILDAISRTLISIANQQRRNNLDLDQWNE